MMCQTQAPGLENLPHTVNIQFPSPPGQSVVNIRKSITQFLEIQYFTGSVSY